MLMARARQRDEWQRTGDLIATISNRTRWSDDDPVISAKDVIPKALQD